MNRSAGHSRSIRWFGHSRIIQPSRIYAITSPLARAFRERSGSALLNPLLRNELIAIGMAYPARVDVIWHFAPSFFGAQRPSVAARRISTH
jgi:hypothetical protein